MITKATLVRIPLIWLVVLLIFASLPNVAFGQTGDPLSDLGDAPDSSNSSATPMAAYAGVPAQFPTVFNGPAPFGPKHLNQSLKFHLGAAISPEEEADRGYDADADGGNNLHPAATLANRDGGDDGFALTELAGHCRLTQARFTVTVADVSDPIFLNLWLDWDRSGAWGDASGLNCETGSPNEWAVRNHAVQVSAPGVYTFTTPPFLTWNPTGGQTLWVRATLSEAAAATADGAGPQAGYLFGETEDYLILPHYRLFVPSLLGGQAEEEAVPEEAEPTGEFTEPADVRAIWPQRPEGDASGVAGVDALALQLREQAGVGRESVSVQLTVFANGVRTTHTLAPGRLMVSQTLTLTVDLGALGIDPALLRSPGRIEASVIATDTLGQAYHGGSERIFFHGHEDNPKMMVIYGQEAASRQFSALSLDHNPTLSSRLAGLIPAGLDMADTGEIGVYDSSDPILREPPPDPVADETGPPAEPIPDPDIPALGVAPADATAALANYLICVRMWAAPDDSSQGDLGQIGFWKGRGAHVIIYHDGKKMWNGWLNIHGCMTLSSNRSGQIVVSYQGEHKLRFGDSSMQLDLMPATASNGSFNHVKGTAIIQNPSTSGVNVAPLMAFDSMAILAYGIQERIFDPGLDGERLWVKRIGCGDEPGAGACSTKRVGKQILFLDPTNLSSRQKFIIMHEFGHALLKMAATDWRQDCSYGPGDSGFHTRRGIEYSSCAAGEGWAHFISTAAWNLREGQNPDGVFGGWDAENGGPDTALCTQQNALNCDGWGVELDWLRHLWDYFTNDRPQDPGSPPSLAQMIDVYDAADWKKNGQIHASKRIEQHLNGSMLTRWKEYGCFNGIRTGCP